MTIPVDPLVPPGSADVVLPEPLSETEAVEPAQPDDVLAPQIALSPAEVAPDA